MSVQKDAKWWDGHARSYAKKPVSDEAGYQRTLKRVTGFLKPTDRVLELGCGSGSTALNLAPAAQTYLATDISPTMIQIANDKIAASPAPNLSFRVASAETLAAEDARFHTVLGFNYLHLDGYTGYESAKPCAERGIVQRITTSRKLKEAGFEVLENELHGTAGADPRPFIVARKL
ncbi:unnamed protein product [Parascedosporium putredinis]|uniref:Methyltransferase domain-containing protein n=1 Tax=Parascedosporium putredinis TaxID=1442378 RepID=A0A9P1MAM9_9PEZI|nr:unnamed protein product [Parascedosporium putredinis]CAI7996927.1 unnamed protein product [Parascedosporium putredinis]